MDNHEFDTVKAEKENAIAKYRRVRNIARLFKLVEVFVAVTLISWSLIRLPSAVKLSREYLIEFSSYLSNPHVVFIIGNVIVVALYVFSRHFDVAESDSASSAGIVSEEDQKCSTIDRNAAASAGTATYDHELSPPEPQSVKEEISAEYKQIVRYGNAIEKTECEAAAVVIETATKQIQRFQRTQSERLKREISLKPRKEFRRSRTEIRRQVDTSPYHGRRSFDKVDRLSNEEFRLTVESFIEKQQSFLKSQKLAEFSNQRSKAIANVLKFDNRSFGSIITTTN